MTRLLVDGDIVAYRIAAGNEKEMYKVKVSDFDIFDVLRGSVALSEYYEGKTEAKRVADLVGEGATVEYEGSKVNKNIEDLTTQCEMFIQDLQDVCEPKQVDVFFTDSSKTFRHIIATKAPYKGNRDKFKKPLLLNIVKDILMSKYSCPKSGDLEADDMIGITATKLRNAGKDYVIASVDKDLLQIPGKHFNFGSDKFTDVPAEGDGKIWLNEKSRELEGYGFKWFAAQMLLGDRVDNILKPETMKGRGPVKIYDILNGMEGRENIIEVLKELYDDDWHFNENLQLLWILQEEGGLKDSGNWYNKYVKGK